MKCLRFLPALFLFSATLCPAASAATQENPQEQQIRIRVDRVNVGVIVTDARGRFVEGLRHDDFHIFDDEIERPLTDFAAVEEPAQVLLLIEAGPAVYLLESGHLQAANALLSGLSAGDRVGVVSYDAVPKAILDFTSDKLAAAAAFSRLQYNLGFGALNLSSSLSKVLEWLRSVQGKKTIVLLSTGLDTSAPDETAATLQQLRIGDVRLLAVSLSGGLQNTQPASKKKNPAPAPTQTTLQFEQANGLLKRMAEATGGRAFFPMNSREFDAAYATIAEFVRHEYSLAFTPPARDGLVHSITVRVGSTQNPLPSAGAVPYRVDHRQAYLAPSQIKP